VVSEKMAIFDKYMVSSDCRYTVDCVLRVIIIIIIITADILLTVFFV